jgi:hypothetical protein
MAIDKTFPSNPVDIIHTGLSFVQKWCRLLRPTDQEKLTEGVEKLQSWLHNYIPLQATTSDIAVL